MGDQPLEAPGTIHDERRTTGIVEHDPPAGEHVVGRIGILVRWEDVRKRDQVRFAFEIAQRDDVGVVGSPEHPNMLTGGT